MILVAERIFYSTLFCADLRNLLWYFFLSMSEPQSNFEASGLTSVRGSYVGDGSSKA